MKWVRWAVASTAAIVGMGCAKGEPLTAPTLSFQDLGLAPPSLPTLTPLTPLVIPTYDGSGQAVHPDILWFPGGWRGWEYWMAFSPYRGGESKLENASLVVSHDGIAWQVPSGLTNPVVPPPQGGYNSDPDLSYDAVSDRLVLLNREVRGPYNRVTARFSQDGVTWGGARLLFMRRNHGIISPALVLAPGRSPAVWYVDAGAKKCPKRITRVTRQTADGLASLAPAKAERGWGPAKSRELSQPGQMIWHLDVTWVQSLQEYWAVYPAYASTGCGARDLYFARSSDGVAWTTYPSPLLRHEDAAWTSAMLYRASMLYDPARDAVRLFLSASAPGEVWRLGSVEFRYRDMIARLAAGSAAGQAPPIAAPGEVDLP